ncbi:hypothetical protein V2A60_009392 [Cordyceps javanica]|uniref:Fungal specific transcription factor n=1 Tax=Cordyceps javanica TaxID=43265 RepID=A0A545VMP0_9HYPO|nr:fungal specific transcription factor [Cordyceps javanica]TQW02999.1 fungal specific transcription factor [Cordyceps javanica]
MSTTTSTTTIKRPRPVFKAGRFKVPKSAGKATVFTVLAPYAHSVLDLFRNWDSPIGYGIRWFDDAMARLQEAIGGPQRDDIYGNELKYKIIKGIGSALQLGFETDWDKRKRLKAEAEAREEARRLEENVEVQRIEGLEELIQLCDRVSDGRPDDADLAAQIRQSCEDLEAAVRTAAEEDAAEAGKKEPSTFYYWFGDCKVSTKPEPRLWYLGSVT